MKYNFVYNYIDKTNKLLVARQVFIVNTIITQNFLNDVEEWIKENDKDLKSGSNPVIIGWQKLEE